MLTLERALEIANQRWMSIDEFNGLSEIQKALFKKINGPIRGESNLVPFEEKVYILDQWYNKIEIIGDYLYESEATPELLYFGIITYKETSYLLNFGQAIDDDAFRSYLQKSDIFFYFANSPARIKIEGFVKARRRNFRLLDQDDVEKTPFWLYSFEDVFVLSADLIPEPDVFLMDSVLSRAELSFQATAQIEDPITKKSYYAYAGMDSLRAPNLRLRPGVERLNILNKISQNCVLTISLNRNCVALHKTKEGIYFHGGTLDANALHVLATREFDVK